MATVNGKDGPSALYASLNMVLWLSMLMLVVLGSTQLYWDPFIPLKRIVLGLFIGLSFCFLGLAHPRFQPKLLVVLVACAAIFVAHGVLVAHLHHRALNILGMLQDLNVLALTFLWLVLFGYQLERFRELLLLNSFLAAMVSIIGLMQALGVNLDFIPLGQGPTSTLANINMVAQYLVFSTAALVFAPSRREGWERTWTVLVTSLAVAYTLSILNRSGLIGFLLLGVLDFRLGRFRWRERLQILVSCIAIMVVLRSFDAAVSISSTAQISGKATNSSGRLFLWEKCLDLFRDYPWLGIGRGNFEQVSAPYVFSQVSIFSSEGMVIDTPHNEILQILTEFGLVLGLPLILGFVILLAWPLLRVLTTDRRKAAEQSFEIALLLALLPELVFQFPLQLPVGQIFISLLLATFVHRRWPELIQTSQSKRKFRGLLSFVLILPIGSFFMWNAWRLHWAERANHDPYADLATLTQSCEQVPEHWRVCTKSTYARLHLGQVQEVILQSRILLDIYPGFYFYERVLIEALLRSGETRESRERFQEYRSRFRGGTSLDAFFM